MRVWKEDEIKILLAVHDKVVYESLVQIYNCQTEDEKLYKETSHDNGIGFNAFDSKILSSFAEFYLEHGYLTRNQLEVARRKLVKYAKQITKLANAYEHKKASEHDGKYFND